MKHDPPPLIDTQGRSTPPIDDGVDATLIRWMLSLTPMQRLSVLQQQVDAIAKLRDARETPR